MWSVVPISTILPAYITATRSALAATMPKSCVTRMTATPVETCTSLSSVRYWAWMVTSSDVVGSSAMSRRGVHEKAMALDTRCRIPPLNWWGYCPSLVSAAEMRRRLRASSTRSRSGPPRSP